MPYAPQLLEEKPETTAHLKQGLSDEEVRRRREQYGENRLPEQKATPLFRILIDQFLDPIIYILMAAAVLAFVFEEWIEGFAVVAVIIITAGIGFFMEWQAVRSMEALRQMAQTMARVLRNGRELAVKASELVPGDIILLEVGDVVPADARLFAHENLAVKEAALTGESMQVEKDTRPVSEDAPLAERYDTVFKGTLITRGTAKALVTGTGLQTELGKISKMTQEAIKEATPLEKRLRKLSQRLIWLTLVLAAFIAVAGYIQGKNLKIMIETAIALSVAAIPEGLPIVATIALARGMLRLAKKKVIIKKLEAVQTLGETGIICTDKTGTLTENQMAAQEIIAGGSHFSLSRQTLPADFQKWKLEAAFDKLIKVGILCNNVKPEERRGDPIEIGLLDLAQAAGYDIAQVRKNFPEEMEDPFDTETKMMATLNRAEAGYWLCVKGALENVLERCDGQLIDGEKVPLENSPYWIAQTNKLAAKGLRTLAFAIRETESKPPEENLIQHLTFLGIIGFIDPPRADVRAAIEACQQAGIRVVMVTGDHLQTARKIAEETGLLPLDASEDKIVPGSQLRPVEELSPEEQKKLLNAIVFGRVTPAHKLDLVTLYQKNNFIVGMTGDGVNDAPALKKADIGIAMGIRGTEAAKEVADIILKDDKFDSIELAIRQGRVIFENIRKFVVYLLSSNMAEIISVALASLTNLPLPLLPLQILYLNLVTDVFPALALGVGKGEEQIMDYPPRSPKDPILGRRHWISILVYGLSITAGVIGITAYSSLVLELPREQVNNLAFYTLVMGQLLNVFNLPKRGISFWRNEVTANPWIWGAIVLCILLTAMGYLLPLLREVLSLVPIDIRLLGLVALFSLSTLFLAQAVKRLGGTV